MAALEQQSVKVTFDDYCKTLEEFKTSLKLSPKDMMTTQWVNMMIQRIQDAEQIVTEQGYSSLHETIKATLRTYLVSMKDNKKTLVLKPIPGKEHRSKTIVPLEETFEIVQKAHVQTNHGSPQQIKAWLESNNIWINDICAEVYCKLYAEFLRKSQSPPIVVGNTLEQEIAEIESAVFGITGLTTTNQDTLHHHHRLLQFSQQTSTAEQELPTNSARNTNPNPPLTIESPSNQDTQATTTTIEDKHKKQNVDIDKTTDELNERLTTIHNEDVLLKNACTVDVLDISENPDNLYQYLLIYQDRKSNYIQLRPMNSNTEANIAVELIKIFMDFGSPKILVVDNEDLGMYLEIMERVKTLTKTEIKLAYYNTQNPLIQRVAKNIVEWIKEQDCNNWGTGCYVVQWNMNNTADSKENTPYSHVFGYKYTGFAYKSKFKSLGAAVNDDSDEDDLNVAVDNDNVKENQDEDKTVKRASRFSSSQSESDDRFDKADTPKDKSNEASYKADVGSEKKSYIVTVTEDVIKGEVPDSLDNISDDSFELLSKLKSGKD